ncbi:MAG TPA: methyltransferase domain-containing protein, partial [Longimicrobiales bacterium]
MKTSLINTTRAYDLLVWLLTFGREDVLSAKFLDLARVRPGERVLDVACGTGELAIAAKRRVGAAGAVSAIDALPASIERAGRKARNVRVDVDFRVAVVELLPFDDAQFDVVLSTLMLHHLPRAARETCMLEIARVLKPGGRVLAIDF